VGYDQPLDHAELVDKIKRNFGYTAPELVKMMIEGSDVTVEAMYQSDLWAMG